MSNSYSEFAARVRVPAGILLGLIYIVFSQPTLSRLIAGSVIALAGLSLRAWAAGSLAKNQRLATGGPYAYMRNPLYLGSLLAGTGYCFAGGRWWFFLLLGAFFGALYWPVIQREENHLRELFPDDYPEYVRAVPAFLPRFGASRRRSRNPEHRTTNGFSWKLYWKNREYEAFAAFLIIVVILSVKLYL
jgi:protein-S-isoprenylcysteine O-methyltransferase Ste14